MNMLLERLFEDIDTAAVRPMPDDSFDGAPKILIVDDEVVSRLVSLQQLLQLDCVPFAASSGNAAFEATIDEGYATARAIRKLELSRGLQRTPIVAVTSDCDADCIDACFAAGMDGHLAKPTSTESLRLVMERFIR